MTLEERIKSDLDAAFKARNAMTTDTLRLLTAALHNRSIEKRGKGGEEKLTEEEALEVLRREAKKRKEAAMLYIQGNRQDLAEKENAELSVLSVYLPAQMGEDEIKKEIMKVLASAGAADTKEFGKVMGLVMKELKGKADAGVVTRILKESLS
jgi:hypothetical protein